MRKYMLLLVLLSFTSPVQAANPLLERILEEVYSSYNRQERPMVIFDLDGTLFDNRPRILKILKEYAEAELKNVRTEDAKKIAALDVERIQYALPETLRLAGITDQGVINNAAIFWAERFFDDDYLKYDKPTPGIVQYVRTLYSSGARVIYLTARDAPRQLLGTVKALRDHGFPIGIQGTELIMRPSAQTQDAVYKQQVTSYLRHYGKVIAAFDNEPANANVYRRAFKESTCVLFEAPSSPNPPPLSDGINRLPTFDKGLEPTPTGP
ncbi:MAG: HAD hydrolase-like protein [Myxococcota bacterium]|nr:HAD hydrolase-like protein [Myxococcota bacterium]